MSKKPELSEKIKTELTTWSVKKDVTEFIKERMGLKSKGSEKINAEELIDNAISRAKVEEKPEWTGLLLKSIETKEEKKSGTQINFFSSIAEATNEGVDKLIDVTPEKKGNDIMDLI